MLVREGCVHGDGRWLLLVCFALLHCAGVAGPIQALCSQSRLPTASLPALRTLAVLDLDGKPLASKTVSVNQPLRFGGVTAYQTDWSMSGLQLQVEGSEGLPQGVTFQLPMASLQGEWTGAGRDGLLLGLWWRGTGAGRITWATE